MITSWKDAHALHTHGTIFDQQFDGIEPVGDYLCLIAYYGDNQIKGYLPPSELGVAEPTEQDVYNLLGYPIPVVVQKIVRDNNAIILSRRIAVNRLARRFWSNIEVGQEVDGIQLTRAWPGQALLVDLGGITAEVPPDEISWHNWVDPKELQQDLPQFGRVKVKIVGYDKDTGTVTASIKALREDPWRKAIPERYPRGTVHRGIITGENHTGAFVKFSDGVVCLCDKKTFWEAKVPIEPGVGVVVRIRNINHARRRVNGKVIDISAPAR